MEELSRRTDPDEGAQRVISPEDGGAGAMYGTRSSANPPVIRFGIEDAFVQQGSEDELFGELGLTPLQVADEIERNLR